MSDSQQDELFDELRNIHGMTPRLFPEEAFLRQVKSRFPSHAFGIDWARVPACVTSRSSDDASGEEAASSFFARFLRDAELADDAEVVWWGDLFMDTGCVMAVSELRRCIGTIVEYPHNVLFVTPDFSWCMTWYSEDFGIYGRSPPSGPR